MKEFTSVVISGGAFWTTAAVGAIKRVLETQKSEAIKTLVGTSAGALICTGLALKITPDDMLEFMLKELDDPASTALDVTEMFDVFTSFGISSGKNLDSVIDHLLDYGKVPRNINFMEFAKLTGKDLVVCVSNVSKSCYEFWCVNETPMMEIRQALRTSCAIPFVVTPVKYNGDFYADGCIFNNFPINFFKKHLMKDIFAIRIYDFDSTKQPTSFLEYASKIMVSMIYNITEMNIEQSAHKDNILQIKLKIPNLVSFDAEEMKFIVSKHRLIKAFLHGYKNASESLLAQQE
jgi:predicted acylesterase/phospholipase RssA